MTIAKTTSAFTLIELLVVIAIIGILASVITPAVHSAVRKARSTKCRSNLYQLAKVILNYSIDHQGCYPRITNDWRALTAKYLPDSDDRINEVFFCPAVRGIHTTKRNRLGDYGANVLALDGSRTSQIYSHATTILLADRGVDDDLALTRPDDFQKVFDSRRHGSKTSPEVNIAFCDGHVSAVTQKELQKAFNDKKIKFQKTRAVDP